MCEVVRIHQVKRAYVERFRSLYIVGEDLNFFWDIHQVIEFDALWRAGWSIFYIADHFGRDPDEIVLLVMDRKRKDKIGDRKGGVFGWREKNEYYKPRCRRGV